MYLPKDPLRRFIDIFEVLNTERGWFSDASSLRFAAMAAITCEGAPASVVVPCVPSRTNSRNDRAGSAN